MAIVQQKVLKDGTFIGNVNENSNMVSFFKNDITMSANIFNDPNGNYYCGGSDYPATNNRSKGKYEIIASGNTNCHQWVINQNSLNYATVNFTNNTKTYICSIDILATNIPSATAMSVYINLRYLPGHTNSISANAYLDPQYNGKWHRYSMKLTGNAAGQNSCLFGFSGSNCSGATILYRNIKIEENTTASPYIPAGQEYSMTYNAPVMLNEIIEN